MPPKAAIHLSNNYKVATQKERAGDASGAFLRTDGEAYSLGLPKAFLRDMSRLDKNTYQRVRERIGRILERPFELGEEKHGAFKGFWADKFEGQNFVLLYVPDKQKRIVYFARYDHHDVVYRNVPSIEDAAVIQFEQWALMRH